MFRRISNQSLTAVFGVAYLGLMTNALLVVAALPLVVLLMTSDPASTWPALAVAAPLAAPGLTAAFTVFREHAGGGAGVVRVFLSGWRATWRRAMALGALGSAAAVVLIVDLHLLGSGDLAPVVVPALAVVLLLVATVALIGLVAIAEVPHARLGEVLRASAYLGIRRWYLTLVSLAVLVVQFAIFANLPAIGLGLTAAPALYLAWANSRYTLRPVLDIDEVAAE